MATSVPAGGNGRGGSTKAVGVALVLSKRAYLLIAMGARRLGIVKRSLSLCSLRCLGRLCSFLMGDGASISVSEGSS